MVFVWFLGVLCPKMWPAAVLGSGSAHRVFEWSGGAGRKPSNQSHPDQHHHLPTGSTRYFICVHVAMPLVHFLFGCFMLCVFLLFFTLRSEFVIELHFIISSYMEFACSTHHLAVVILVSCVGCIPTTCLIICLWHLSTANL